MGDFGQRSQSTILKKLIYKLKIKKTIFALIQRWFFISILVTMSQITNLFHQITFDEPLYNKWFYFLDFSIRKIIL